MEYPGETRFSYLIEPKPGGGFIARAREPNQPDFEGATQEEVQEKLRAYALQMVEQELDKLHLGGLKTVVHTKLTEHKSGEASHQITGSQQVVESQQVSSTGSPVTIEPEGSSQTVVKVLIALVVAALFIYWWMHR